MTETPKQQDTCELVSNTVREKQYHVEIYQLLESKGWKKLALDSLWVHSDHGILHILFALYVALKPMKQSSSLLSRFALIGLALGIIIILVGGLLCVFLST